MQGEPIERSVGVGTNVGSSEPQIPRAVVVGIYFSEDELQKMLQVAEGKGIPWLAPAEDTRDYVRTNGVDCWALNVVPKVKAKLVEVVAEDSKLGLWRY